MVLRFGSFQIFFSVAWHGGREDERTEDLDVISLSMRGAQREITGSLIDVGYKPDGRWVQEADGETWRRFKVAA